MVDGAAGTIGVVPPAEVEDVELYHPHSWWTTYVFSQDAKVIALQYSLTAAAIGMVALMISWLLVRTKSLGACIVAHAVTNLLLGIYVLWAKDWYFW